MIWRCAALLVVVALVSGCNKQPKPTLMANMAKKEITVSQLRAIDYEYAARFGHAVAASAHEIVTEAEDADVVEHALRWRMWATPQARAAAFAQDPLTALIELWILASQQHQFFAVGEGKTWFGAQQQHALATTEHLQEKAELLMAQTMSADALRAIQEKKRDWIESHPIEGKLVARPTARADLANLVPPRHGGTFQAAASIQESVGDMNDRITILTEQAPVEARWQAEYLVASLFEERLYHDMDVVVGSLSTMTEFLDTFEETAATQTAAIFEGIRGERIMVFDAIERERAEILAAIALEREVVLGSVDTQLSKATADIDELTRGLIDEGTAELKTAGRDLIDHFFVRLLQFLVIVAAGVLLFRWVTRRRKDAVADHHDRTE